MDNCEYSHVCQNNDKCYRCADQRLLKIKGQKGQRKTAGLLDSHDYKKANADN